MVRSPKCVRECQEEVSSKDPVLSVLDVCICCRVVNTLILIEEIRNSYPQFAFVPVEEFFADSRVPQNKTLICYCRLPPVESVANVILKNETAQEYPVKFQVSRVIEIVVVEV